MNFSPIRQYLAKINTNSLWWLAIIAIFLVGVILRYTGYNFQLPYISNNDEAMSNAQTLHLRGLYLQSGQIAGYPPGNFIVDGLSEIIGEQITGQSALAYPAIGLQIARALAVFMSLLNLPAIGLLAKRLAGPIAGLLATLIWLMLPANIEHSTRALSEAWQLLFWTLALYWAIIAYEDSKPTLAVLSVLAGIGAFVFKYNAFLAIALGFGITIWKLLRVNHERRRWWLTLGAQLGCTALAIFLLFFVYDSREILNAGDSAYALHGGGLTRILTLSNGLTEINISISEFVGIASWLFVLILCAGSWLYITQSKRTKREDRLFVWLLLFGFAVLWAWSVISYATVDVNLVSHRYVLPATLIFALLFAISLTLCGDWLGQRSRQTWVSSFVAIIFSLIWVVPTGRADWNISQSHTVPDTRAEVQLWSSKMLGDGVVLIDNAGGLIYNKEWGGYPGPYRIWINADITSRSITDWIKDNVNYALLSEGTRDRLQQTSLGSKYLSQLMLLKQFPPSGQEKAWFGPQFNMYRLRPAQHTADYHFGDSIHLTGYDLDTTQLRPGQTLHITLYWKATSQPVQNYSVFIHLVNLDSEVPLAQVDGSPAGPNRLPHSWTDPSETLISNDLQMQLPADLPPGVYRLNMGLYDYGTGQRLPTQTGDFVEISKVSVEYVNF